jgi:hypothetical protein
MNPLFEEGQSVKAFNGNFHDLGVVKTVSFDEKEQSWRYLIRFRAGYEGDVSEVFVQATEA